MVHEVSLGLLENLEGEAARPRREIKNASFRHLVAKFYALTSKFEIIDRAINRLIDNLTLLILFLDRRKMKNELSNNWTLVNVRVAMTRI